MDFHTKPPDDGAIGDIMEPLGGGAILKEIYHCGVGPSGFMMRPHFLFFLFPDCECNVIGWPHVPATMTSLPQSTLSPLSGK